MFHLDQRFGETLLVVCFPVGDIVRRCSKNFCNRLEITLRTEILFDHLERFTEDCARFPELAQVKRGASLVDQSIAQPLHAAYLPHVPAAMCGVIKGFPEAADVQGGDRGAGRNNGVAGCIGLRQFDRDADNPLQLVPAGYFIFINVKQRAD